MRGEARTVRTGLPGFPLLGGSFFRPLIRVAVHDMAKQSAIGESLAPFSELRLHPPDGMPYEGRRVLQLQLLLDVAAMDVDGLWAQVQLTGYVAGALSQADELENLEFPVGQFLDR